MTEYTLTVARKSQVQDIFKLTRRAFKEGAESKLEIDQTKMLNMVNHLVCDDHQLAVVAMKDGKPKGVILGHVDSHAYAKGLVASDICIYVSPTLRGTDCCERLVEVYTSWCSRIPGLVGSTLGVSNINATTPYMEHLFKKQGYSKSGITYLKLAE